MSYLQENLGFNEHQKKAFKETWAGTIDVCKTAGLVLGGILLAVSYVALWVWILGPLGFGISTISLMVMAGFYVSYREKLYYLKKQERLRRY